MSGGRLGRSLLLMATHCRITDVTAPRDGLEHRSLVVTGSHSEQQNFAEFPPFIDSRLPGWMRYRSPPACLRALDTAIRARDHSLPQSRYEPCKDRRSSIRAVP